MKTEMSEDGVITIRPESSMEAFALRQWNEQAFIKIHDPQRLLDVHMDPRKIIINTDWEGTQEWMQGKIK